MMINASYRVVLKLESNMNVSIEVPRYFFSLNLEKNVNGEVSNMTTKAIFEKHLKCKLYRISQ
jgi:hypothetical protein